MTPAYPQLPGFPLPFQGGRGNRLPAALSGGAEPPEPPALAEVPDRHSQLEDLLGHVRRCERWARLDDRIDLRWRLDGNR
jgi:hypothetical protein